MSHMCVWAFLKIMYGGNSACMHQALWITVRHEHRHLYRHYSSIIGIIPAEGGWTVSNNNRMLYVTALIHM
jgi:hypothetical protein